jgi:ATP-binding cassette subfamily F protein 3
MLGIMPIVTLKDIHKSFGPSVVFSGLSGRFFSGEKVGVIGANGSGKTTLLKIILGTVEADIGKIVRRKGLRIGYLAQEVAFEQARTVMEEMHAGFEDILRLQEQMARAARRLSELSGGELKKQMAEYERLSRRFELAGGYEYETRIKRILAGLGFGENFYDAEISGLSGGQLSRLGLAKVLSGDNELLLLDEPTNHLDLEGTVWLENFVKSYSGTVIIISHDRLLLDRVVGRIVVIEKGGASSWKGNYSSYVANKNKQVLQEQREYAKRSEMVARTRDFIARNKDKEGMRKTARGRKKRLDKLLAAEPEFLARPTSDRGIKFRFGRGKGRSKIVLRCEGMYKSFDKLVLFEDLSFDVLAGQRLGITGPNGTGKSTLLKMAMGQLDAGKGTVKMGANLVVGYLDQHAQMLDRDKTVLEEVAAVRTDLGLEALRGRMGAFLFRGDDVLKQVGDLSGGEQNRLMLCKLVLSEPDVLVLDEPTNHLDIASREMLEEALGDYAGTVIVVSHDRFFLDKVVDRLLIVGVDKFGKYRLGQFEFVVGKGGKKGVYSHYTQLLEDRAAVEISSREKTGRDKRKQGKTVNKKLPKELRSFNKFSTEKLEEMIIVFEDEITGLQEKFGDEKIYKDHTLLAELQEELRAKQHELTLLYRAYEARAG